jgi:hypothetical protein
MVKGENAIYKHMALTISVSHYTFYSMYNLPEVTKILYRGEECKRKLLYFFPQKGFDS